MESSSTDTPLLGSIILDSIPIAVMFVKPCWSRQDVTDGLIVYTNIACSKILRIDRDELIGNTLLSQFPHLTQREVWRKYLFLLVSPGEFEFEYQVDHENEIYYYKAHLVHVSDGLCIIFEDVSNLKAATELAMEALTKAEQANARLLTEIRAKTALEEEFKRQAITDPLTNALNRRGFDDALSEMALSAAATGGFLSLIIFDIDFFKRINDLYGHEVGDLVLRKVVGEASRFTSHDAVLGRIGGEEFGLALRNVPLPDAIRVADDMRRLVARSFVKVGGDVVKWTISVGVQEFTICGSLDRLRHDADTALLIAKRQGKNMVIAFALAVDPDFYQENEDVIYI